ncbi:hypothetical protein BH10ACI2_BH10ACI2_04470 [soil metagenome]
MISRSTALVCCLVLLFVAAAAAQNVRLITKLPESRVDVMVDGKLFTSYRWDRRIKRPVLYPIIANGGAIVTRGFPFETRDGESIDHPHQVGSSLSYGSVNGVDFWNTSTFRTAEELKKMGRIEHLAIVSTKGGKGSGELITISAWIGPDGVIVLKETTKYMFHAQGKTRWIDRVTKLTAVSKAVVFGDSKEGMFAVRVASELEQEDQTGVKVTTVDGTISERPVKNFLSGKYFTSEGLYGEKVWGTLGKWAAVSGKIGTKEVTLAVFDHPKNPNFPSRMMVRGYGLLALNPFGQKLFDAGKTERSFRLAPHRSITFKHRVLIMSGKMSPTTIARQHSNFIK